MIDEKTTKKNTTVMIILRGRTSIQTRFSPEKHKLISK